MQQPGGDFSLPRLRHDLQLFEGPQELDGSPSWVIIDPLRNKYFSIGWSAFQLLSRWSLGKASVLVRKVQQDTALTVSLDDVKKLAEFLFANSLTIEPPSGKSSDYVDQYAASRPNFLLWLIHNYLFIKIPLVRPNRFLRATLPYVQPLYSKTTAMLVFCLGLIGLYIVGREWDEFTHTFLYFFSLQGFVFYVISLIFVKVMHELAHAYTAVRYGANIPTMGVAFMVLFPLLYTDTSDTWRIKNPVDRMYVGGAGMMMELYIAAFATFCWSFLPDGLFKSAAFILATTSWVLSVLINLNPLMRFDGYYILSDFIGVKNLQERSFALGKWKLREILFELNLPAPEQLDRNMADKLAFYAWAVWIYRFFLFLGIAVLVYHFFIKLLGILLFLIEIVWFIIVPVAKEIRVWWGMRMFIMKSVRFYITLAGLVTAITLLVLPWSSHVNIPAVQVVIDEVTLHTPAPGYIETSNIAADRKVKQGDVLLVLNSPELDYEIEKTLKEIEIQQTRASRIAASPDELSEYQVILQQIQELESKHTALKEQQEQLIIKAPIGGVLRDVEESLHAGRWINQKLPIARVLNPSSARIIGLIEESDLKRIGVHREVKFIPDDATRAHVWGYVQEVEVSNARSIDQQILASLYGGPVPSKLDDTNTLVPEKSVYRVRITISPVEKFIPEQELRGVARITGDAKSLLTRIYESAAAILVRESGF